MIGIIIQVLSPLLNILKQYQVTSLKYNLENFLSFLFLELLVIVLICWAISLDKYSFIAFSIKSTNNSIAKRLKNSIAELVLLLILKTIYFCNFPMSSMDVYRYTKYIIHFKALAAWDGSMLRAL